MLTQWLNGGGDEDEETDACSKFSDELERNGFKILKLGSVDGAEDNISEDSVVISSTNMGTEVMESNRTKWDLKIRKVIVFCEEVEKDHGSYVHQYPNLV